MEQIKLKTFTAETLELLESNINEFLGSEEATNLKLVNITIKEIEERTFPNKGTKVFCAFLYRRNKLCNFHFQMI